MTTAPTSNESEATLPSPRPEEQWEKFERLVYKVCHTFRKKYGGEFCEILSEAYPHYVKALQTFNPSKGKVEKRVTYIVWNMLLQSRMRDWQRQERLPCEDNEEGTLPDSYREFNLQNFLEQLSEDAQNAVKLVLDAGAVPHLRSREGLARHLVGRGWAGQRVLDLWWEIREALNR